MFRRTTLQIAALSLLIGSLITAHPVSAHPKKLEPITVGILKFGTARWEMHIIKKQKLDEKFGIKLEPSLFPLILIFVLIFFYEVS